MVRFLHTSDWQLGITRRFLDSDAQARFAQARLDAVRHLGRIASEQRCDFIVVAGDVFESNFVKRRTIERTIGVLRSIEVPVYLLPGNHDPLDAGSVYRNARFQEADLSHIHVLRDREPVRVAEGVELRGVPWTTKHPTRDPVADLLRELEPTSEIRIVVAHGGVSTLAPDRDDPSLIDIDAVENGLSEGRLHYLALGDRHSWTEVGRSGRILYSGTPEQTDYREDEPGRVLVVEVDRERVEARPVQVGTWTFIDRDYRLESAEDLDRLKEELGSLESRERCIVRLTLVGTLDLVGTDRLERILEEARAACAAVVRWGRNEDLALAPRPEEIGDLGLTGFAAAALDELLAQVEAGEPTAVDAVRLLVRLSGRTR